MITVPPGQVASARVTVKITDSDGPMVVAVDQFYDDLKKCKDIPVLGSTLFTPCAHPDYLEGPVKRFNLIVNSSAEGPDRGKPDDGTDR